MILELLKEIFKFIFNLCMLLFAIVVITKGGNALNIGIFAIIPFIYFFAFYSLDANNQNEKIENLESNLKYYKHRLEQYEPMEKED